VIPLAMVAVGEWATVQQIRGGRRMRRRLADLGLAPGVAVRLVQAGVSGPIIVAFKNDARVAIGRGMACRILAVPGRP